MYRHTYCSTQRQMKHEKIPPYASFGLGAFTMKGRSWDVLTGPDGWIEASESWRRCYCCCLTPFPGPKIGGVLKDWSHLLLLSLFLQKLYEWMSYYFAFSFFPYFFPHTCDYLAVA